MFSKEILLSDLIIRIFTIVFLALIVIYLLKGYFKGYKKMTVRLGFLLLSVLLSLLVTFMLSDLLLGWARDIVSGINDTVTQDLLSASPTFVEYVYAIVAGLVAPCLFLIIFIIISMLMLIPGLFVNKTIQKLTDPNGEKPKKTKRERFIGMGVGFLVSMVVSGCLFMPFVGYMNFANGLFEQASSKEIIIANDYEKALMKNIDKASSSPIAKFEYWLTKPLFNGLTKIRTKSGSSTIDEEIGVYSLIYDDILMIANSKATDMTQFDFSLIDKIVDDVSKSESLTAVLAEVIRYGSQKWANDETFLNLNIKRDLRLHDDLDDAIKVLLEDFAVTNEHKVATDVKNMTATFKTALSIADTLYKLQFNDITKIDTQPLYDAIETIEGNDKLKGIMSALLAKAGDKWSNGETFLGISATKEVPSDLHNTLNVVFKEFSRTTKETVCEDTRNFVSAIEVMSELTTNIQALNFNDYTSFNTQQLDDIIKKIDSNDLVVKMTAVLVNDAGHAWGDTPPRAFLNANPKENLPEKYKTAFDGNLEQFKRANERNVVNVLGTFSDTLKSYKYMINLSSPNISDAELKQNVEDFVTSLNTNNVDILKGTINEEILQDAGIGKDNSPIISELVKSSMNGISVMDEEQKKKEAEYLNVFLTYSKDGSQNTTTDSEYVDAIVKSQSLSGAVEDYVQAGNTAKIVGDQGMLDAVNNYDTQGDPEAQKTIDALKQMLTVREPN